MTVRNRSRIFHEVANFAIWFTSPVAIFVLFMYSPVTFFLYLPHILRVILVFFILLLSQTAKPDRNTPSHESLENYNESRIRQKPNPHKTIP